MIYATIIFKGLSLAGVYFLISFGVTLVYGVGGFPNLAIGPIGLTGAYITGTLIRKGLNLPLSILIGVIGSVIVGMGTQRFVVDPLYKSGGMGERGRIFVIYGTFGLLLLFPAILLNTFETTMMTMKFPSLGVYNLFGASMTGYELLSIVIAIATLLIAHITFNKTLPGNKIRSVTQNPILAQVIGINVKRVYLVTASISSICAYIGAVLWGEIFSLELSSGVFFTLYGFIMAVIGGLGSIYGAFVISLVFGITLSASSFLIGGVFEYIITTVFLVIVLLLKPMGVIPTRREV
jgi:branched-subunit amino acid ABC-type transport system permease component